MEIFVLLYTYKLLLIRNSKFGDMQRLGCTIHCKGNVGLLHTDRCQMLMFVCEMVSFVEGSLRKIQLQH
jgi:hypothetical protein